MHLSFDDENYILLLAEVLSPSSFINGEVFVAGNSNFYDISYTKLTVAATKEFIVSGMRVTKSYLFNIY